MAVPITGIDPQSPAERAGLRTGELLLSVNGHAIADVFDYQFYTLERKLRLTVQRGTKVRTVLVRKEEYEDLGLQFETYLMDQQRSCRNHCIFCFIDQLPKGLRESLYFKDDDARLSFLFGNYITLTNLKEKEVKRIIDMHISPVNVSVHTTNPALRVKMMGNRFAGEVLRYLKMLADGGISLNCQLVLCPGYNDGEELARSLRDLAALRPAVQSICMVPVGLTKFREGLTPLTPFTQETAGAVVDLAEAFGEECLTKFGTRLCYPSDEFYLKAKRPIPPASFYEEFVQLENGVGMLSLLCAQFHEALAATRGDLTKSRTITIVTGKAAAPFITSLIDEAKKRWHNLDGQVIAIENEFFGPQITVSGLITGKDIMSQLTGRALGEEVLLSSSMLRREGDLFLDDVSLSQLQEALGVPVTPVDNDGAELLHAVLGGAWFVETAGRDCRAAECGEIHPV